MRRALLRKEGLCSLIALAVLGLGAVFYPLAPVGSQTASGAADAPWVFVGFQQLLRWLPTWLGGLLLPATALAYLALIPWLSVRRSHGEPVYGRPSVLEVIAWLVLAAWAGLTIWALVA
jgi:quinol-cytochrome oxidoreductase complex cytochrome b subunit